MDFMGHNIFRFNEEHRVQVSRVIDACEDTARRTVALQHYDAAGQSRENARRQCDGIVQAAREGASDVQLADLARKLRVYADEESVSLSLARSIV